MAPGGGRRRRLLFFIGIMSHPRDVRRAYLGSKGREEEVPPPPKGVFFGKNFPRHVRALDYSTCHTPSPFFAVFFSYFSSPLVVLCAFPMCALLPRFPFLSP